MNAITMNSLEGKGILGPGLERKDASGSGDDLANVPADVKAAVEKLLNTHEEFKNYVETELGQIKENGSADPVTSEAVTKLNGELDRLTKQVDQLRLENERPSIEEPDGSTRKMSEAEVELKAAVATYIRSGNNAKYDELSAKDEFKALTAGNNPQAGYLVTPEMDNTIRRVVGDQIAIRGLATVRTISSSSYEHIVNVAGTASGWVGESSSRTVTSEASLRKREIVAHELYAMPSATQTLLDDASLDIEAWLAGEVAIEFAEAEATAFITGDGSNKPRGIIGGYTPVANASFSEAGGAPGYIATGADGAFLTTDDGDEIKNLIDLIHALRPQYRNGASFLMSDATLAVVRKIRDADGNFFWQPSIQAGVPGQLLGYGAPTDDNMPAIASDSFSIAFANFMRAYTIVDRIGTRTLRDPFTSKPNILFYSTRRVGGGITMHEAIKLLKFGTS